MSYTENSPHISIIIPTLNGEKYLQDFFTAIKQQSCQPFEIIVGDSGSSDNTVNICLENSARVIDVDRQQFDHGGTRTALAQLASGEILLFFTQDALPVNSESVANLVKVFAHDPKIGCSYGRQLARQDATIFAAHLREFNYPPVSSVTEYSDRVEKGLRTIFISNTFAAYRRKVLEECGFFKDGLIFGEDTYTLGKILKAGYKVAYVAEASVYHSHNYDFKQEFSRSFDIGVLHGQESWLIDTYGGAEGIGARYIRSIFARLFREKRYLLMLDCLLRNSLKIVGYKLGRNYDRLPEILLPYLSLNSLWWHKNR